MQVTSSNLYSEIGNDKLVDDMNMNTELNLNITGRCMFNWAHWKSMAVTTIKTSPDRCIFDKRKQMNTVHKQFEKNHSGQN